MSEFKQAETLEIESMLGRKFEPKRLCRWIINIDGIDPFLAIKVTRPHVTVMNGETMYHPITLQIYDPISPSGAQMAWEWLDQKDKRDITLKMLDPVGTVVEEWLVEEAELVDVDFGELNYSSAEPATIKLTLKFEKCELKY